MTSCPRCGTKIPATSGHCLRCGAAASDPGAATLIMPNEEDSILLQAVRRELGADYQVEAELGRGGMSVVFRALELGLRRPVALKVLPPELAISPSLADRFKREAKLAASMDHPNIIPIYRVGQAGSLLFIAMKYISGPALDDVIERQGPLPVEVTINVLRAASRALAYAHDRGIVHRDVKSGNILIDRDGRLLISDFGIARAIEDPSLTATGTVVGTPYFMSPEQCAARRIGPRSDQYSLGVVAFHMLTGFVPFHAETLPAIMHHHFYTPVPDIQAARPDIPQPLLEVVNRMLAKRPDHRYPTMQACLDALDGLPFTEPERRAGDEALRTLARGEVIPTIATRPVPPLPDMGLTPAASVLALDPTSRRVRSLRAAALAAGLITLGAGGVWATRPPAPVAPPATVVPAASVPAAKPQLALVTPPHRAAGTTSTVPRAESPRPAPPAPGKLRVRVYPSSAEILVDDAVVGTGVLVDASVPSGERRLRVRAPGYESFDTTLVVAPDETLALRRIALRGVGDPP